MQNQKAFTDRNMTVAFALGTMLGASVIAITANVAAPTNPLQYTETCDAETQVVVLLEDAEGRGNETGGSPVTF